MKLNLFEVSSKVHTQRNVMRDTDNRIANYSRRGLFLNVILFVACMMFGEYAKQQPVMSNILVAGVILLSAIRGYFLFRFEHFYAQAPGRWRNMFFFFSLCGAVWWGFVLAHITLVNGLEYETPLLWLYTIAFFASTMYAFAPYERFLRVHMFVCLIPCALAAIFLFQLMSIFYGLVMLALFLQLSRQARIISKNYWGKLQANYDLATRANQLEAEKITTQSSLSNRDILYGNVIVEIKAAIQEILGSIQLLKYSALPEEEEQLVLLAEQKSQQQINMLKNVTELSSITDNELLLEQQVIDPRFHIEQALNNISIIAHKKNIELYSSFANDFPLRIRGDIDRIEQLIGNMISSACQFCNEGELLVSSSFRFEQDPGQLKISVINRAPIRTTESIEMINDAFSLQRATDMNLGLSLAIFKGLANCMGGNAGAEYREDGSLIFWASIRLPVVSNNTATQNVSLKLSGKRVLLYQPPKTIAEVLQNTLENWGLIVDVIHHEQEALSALEAAVDNKPYRLLMLYTRLNDLDSLSLSKKVAEHEQLWNLPQIVVLSRLQNKLAVVDEHFSKYVRVQVIYKPIRLRRLHKIVKELLIENNESEKSDHQVEDFLTEKRILLFQQEDIDVAIANAMLRKLGCCVTAVQSMDKALTLLGEECFDAFITESHLEDVDLKLFVEDAKSKNVEQHTEHYIIPVLGLTSHQKDSEETQCLASGMDYYIDYPVNIDYLQAILRSWIGRAVHMAENYNEPPKA